MYYLILSSAGIWIS